MFFFFCHECTTSCIRGFINQAMKRKRKTYFLLIISTIVFGLLSRKALPPSFIDPYLGDFLYALMFFFIVGFLFPTMKSLKVVLISIAICYFIEGLQLYQADWINQLRSYKLGGLILGYGFLWSDILSYTFGGLFGYFFEFFYKKYI